jgi:hypothetical protein
MLGLSGVGKDYACCVLKEGCSLLHKDMDQGHAFERAGLPPEWDKNILLVDFGVLADRIRVCLLDDHQGAVLTFPTTYRFDSEQLNVASLEGIMAVLLWGPLEFCWKVRYHRQHILHKKKPPDYNDYLKKNLPTFQIYKCPDYNVFRVANFGVDGSRPSRDVLLARMLNSMANQGLQLNCCKLRFPQTH